MPLQSLDDALGIGRLGWLGQAAQYAGPERRRRRRYRLDDTDVDDFAADLRERIREMPAEDIEDQPHGALQWALEILDLPRNAVANLINTAVGAEPVSKRRAFGLPKVTSQDLLRTLGWTPSRALGHGTGGKVADFVAGFLADVVTDPLTWLTFGAGGLVGSAGKRVGQTTLRAGTERLVDATLRRMQGEAGRTAFRQALERGGGKEAARQAARDAVEAMGQGFTRIPETHPAYTQRTATTALGRRFEAEQGRQAMRGFAADALAQSRPELVDENAVGLTTRWLKHFGLLDLPAAAALLPLSVVAPSTAARAAAAIEPVLKAARPFAWLPEADVTLLRRGQLGRGAEKIGLTDLVRKIGQVRGVPEVLGGLREIGRGVQRRFTTEPLPPRPGDAADLERYQAEQWERFVRDQIAKTARGRAFGDSKKINAWINAAAARTKLPRDVVATAAFALTERLGSRDSDFNAAMTVRQIVRDAGGTDEQARQLVDFIPAGERTPGRGDIPELSPEAEDAARPFEHRTAFKEYFGDWELSRAGLSPAQQVPVVASRGPAARRKIGELNELRGAYQATDGRPIEVTRQGLKHLLGAKPEPYTAEVVAELPRLLETAIRGYSHPDWKGARTLAGSREPARTQRWFAALRARHGQLLRVNLTVFDDGERRWLYDVGTRTVATDSVPRAAGIRGDGPTPSATAISLGELLPEIQGAGVSRVVNADGSPKRVYHGTPAEFREFAPGWNYFSESPEYASQMAGSGGVMPVYLNVRRPLDLREFGTELLTGRQVAELLRSRGVTAQDEWFTPAAAPLYQHLRELESVHPTALQKAGYDGLVFKDRLNETVADTWVTTQPTQIKSASANIGMSPESRWGFDPNNPRIDLSPAPEYDLFGGEILRPLGKDQGQLFTPEQSEAPRPSPRSAEPVQITPGLEQLVARVVRRIPGKRQPTAEHVRAKLAETVGWSGLAEQLHAGPRTPQALEEIQEAIHRAERGRWLFEQIEPAGGVDLSPAGRKIGGAVKMVDSGLNEYQGTLQLVELDDLATSHYPIKQAGNVVRMEPRAGYPEGFQARERTKEQSVHQVAGIAKAPKYELLTEFGPDVTGGPPVTYRLDDREVVIQGNGRAAGMIAWTKRQWEEYRKALIDAGYDVPQGMKKPVLVRRLEGTLDEARRLAALGQESATLKQTRIERARGALAALGVKAARWGRGPTG